MNVELQTRHLSLGIITLEGISLPPDYDPLPHPETEGDVQLARGMYRAIGVDPTRNRPSSEALLRRIRKGQDLPRINALVDALNHCSVALMLPFGCYDLDKVVGEAAVRVGVEEEGFDGVGNRRVNVSGRYTIGDAEGPFGNPSMDSKRTCIELGTRRALVVVYAPPDYAHERLPWVAEVLSEVVGGTAATSIVRR